MSRSIHKTVAQVVRENSKRDLDDPDNPDITELAKKVRYKKLARKKRHAPQKRGKEDEDR